MTKAKYFQKTYSRRRGSQRQSVKSYSKNERKISKTKNKILTHALGNNEKQSLHKSNDEEPNQPITERKFEETWSEERPTKRKKRQRYILVTSIKENKFEMEMKNKEHAKVETSKYANEKQKKISKNINNIADSLKSTQRQIW